MSETLQIARYRCRTCGYVYDSKESADRCEARPLREDRGVKIGDTVRISGGDCAGKNAIVESIYVIDMDAAGRGYDRYWHTVALTAKVIDSWGRRDLPFDDYKTIPQDAVAA